MEGGPAADSGDDRRRGRAIVLGLLVWSIASAIHLAVRGVVLDEVVTAAQIIAGDVPYPPGHPHGAYYPGAYCLSHYLAALQWLAFPDAEFVSALRNLLFLTASTFVPFAFVRLVTRSAFWGHAAAVFALSEATTQYDGAYPIYVFPHWYSHGHIAVQMAVAGVVFVSFRFFRTGGFLLAVLPSFHPGVAAFACAFAVGALPFLALSRPEKRALLAGALPGVLVCVALAAVISWGFPSPTPLPPYDVHHDAAAIVRASSVAMDSHNRLPDLFSVAYLGGCAAWVAAAAALMLMLRRQSWGGAEKLDFRGATTVVALGAAAWLFMGGAWVYLRSIGELPYVLGVIRPFRISNVAVVLIAPLLFAALGRVAAGPSLETRLTAWVVAAGAAALQVAVLVHDKTRWTQNLIAWLLGSTLAAVLAAGKPAGRRRTAAAVCLVPAAAYALLSPSAGPRHLVAFAAGFLAILLVVRLARVLAPAVRSRERLVRGAVAAAFGLAAAACLTRPAIIDRNSSFDFDAARGRWDTISAFDRRVREKLIERHGRGAAMVLPYVHPRLILQAKLDQPVLIDMDTVSPLAYVPEIAPQIAEIARDAWGLDFLDPELARPGRPHLMTAEVAGPIWRSRRRADWLALRAKYGVRYVGAPAGLDPDLTCVLRGTEWSLFEIE